MNARAKTAYTQKLSKIKLSRSETVEKYIVNVRTKPDWQSTILLAIFGFFSILISFFSVSESFSAAFMGVGIFFVLLSLESVIFWFRKVKKRP